MATKNLKQLQFDCQVCEQPVTFSVFDLDKNESLVPCSGCSKKYLFDDINLKRQLRKFEALCRQIMESEEILSHTAVGINVGEHQVKVPYKLLLTRLNSTLNLQIGDSNVFISFRFEPLKDL